MCLLLLFPRQPAPNDESLFEFLNSPLKQLGQSGGTRKATSRVSHSQTKVSHSKTKSQPQLQSQPHQPPSPVKLQPLTSVVNVGGDAGVREEGEWKEGEEGTVKSREQTDGITGDIHENEEGSASKSKKIFCAFHVSLTLSPSFTICQRPA